MDTKFKEIVYGDNEIDDTDFNDFVKLYYGKDVKYNFKTDEDAKSFCVYRYTIKEKSQSDQAKEKILGFMNGNRAKHITYDLLKDLYCHNVIPAGTYIINF